MNPATVPTHVRSNVVSRDNLLEIAKFCDEYSHAISFYFSLASTPDNSHREEAIAVGRLIQEAKDKFAPFPIPASLASDLEDVLAVAEEIRLSPARLRAVFACREKQIWREFDLPASESIRQLYVGRTFQLVPLIAASQSYGPYCVVLLESGKARAFVVRGGEIKEFAGRLPSKDLSLHAEDSRVGWSKRIDKNVGEHEKAYFKNVSHSLLQFMTEQQSSGLLIGCREDLWGEVEPQFTGFEDGVLLGHFHLPSFAMDEGEVLAMAAPKFLEGQRQRCIALLDEINESPSRAAMGVSDVLRNLSEGRAQKLILSKLLNQTISECRDCRRMWVEAGHNCIFCGSAEVRYIAADEGLIRQALISDADILMVETHTIPGFSGVAALLRY
jgi:hypothetical protein